MIQDHFVPLMPHHDPSDLGSYILIQFFPNKPPSSYVPFRGVECFRGIIMTGALKSAKHKRDNVTRKVGFLFSSLQTLERFSEPKRWFLSKSLNPTNQPTTDNNIVRSVNYLYCLSKNCCRSQYYRHRVL